MAMGGIKSKRLEAVLTGGDAIAEYLALKLGRDFAEKLPPRTDAGVALETCQKIMADGTKGALMYGLWHAWAAIQNARHLLGDRTGKPERVFETCTTCAGKGKVTLQYPSPDDPRARSSARARQVICGDCKGQGRHRVVGLS